ncbi:hypothetical protein E2C01_085556 [Portunus trituberculatus]|uniref:Uncharacterized protein n=1 Tax=Portunus trituberculatus TaxID=210409 RepID=A0A5B7J7X3_PORTR|nr:hypothetical protein [Portunus trituberculatus]
MEGGGSGGGAAQNHSSSRSHTGRNAGRILKESLKALQQNTPVRQGRFLRPSHASFCPQKVSSRRALHHASPPSLVQGKVFYAHSGANAWEW